MGRSSKPVSLGQHQGIGRTTSPSDIVKMSWLLFLLLRHQTIPTSQCTGLPSLQNCKKQVSILYKLPGLGCFCYRSTNRLRHWFLAPTIALLVLGPVHEIGKNKPNFQAVLALRQNGLAQGHGWGGAAHVLLVGKQNQERSWEADRAFRGLTSPHQAPPPAGSGLSAPITQDRMGQRRSKECLSSIQFESFQLWCQVPEISTALTS